VRVAGLLLAAGASRRMGRNKALVELGGEPLVRRAARAGLEAGLAPLLVVLGHEPEPIREALAGLAFLEVPNPRHALGMSTSLDAGAAAVPAEADAALVLLADMPLVDAVLVAAVIARAESTAAPLVTARYGGVTAPPTLYARALFPELRGGEGEGRGREVVRRHAGEAAYVERPAEALADVDREEDLERVRALLAGPQ